MIHLLVLMSLIRLASLQNPVAILEDTRKVEADNYYFRYETSDETKRNEEGGFVNGIWSVKGMFLWIGNDGTEYSTRFVADDKGYRILPTDSVQDKSPEGVFVSQGIGSGTSASLLGLG